MSAEMPNRTAPIVGCPNQSLGFSENHIVQSAQKRTRADEAFLAPCHSQDDVLEAHMRRLRALVGWKPKVLRYKVLHG